MWPQSQPPPPSYTDWGLALAAEWAGARFVRCLLCLSGENREDRPNGPTRPKLQTATWHLAPSVRPSVRVVRRRNRNHRLPSGKGREMERETSGVRNLKTIEGPINGAPLTLISSFSVLVGFLKAYLRFLALIMFQAVSRNRRKESASFARQLLAQRAAAIFFEFVL